MEKVRPVLVQERVLRLIGIWPLDAQSVQSIGRWSAAVVIQITTILSLSWEVYRHCQPANETMDAFIMDLSSVVSLSKLFILRFNWRHTYALVNSISEDWSTVRNPRHRRIMMKYFERGKFVSLTILYLGYASGASFILKSVPLEMLIPFQSDSLNSTEQNSNESLSSIYFLATYCVYGSLPVTPHLCVLTLQAMHIFVNATSHCGNDGFFFSLVMHLCGQFKVLTESFSEVKAEELSCKKKLKFLIMRHCRLALLTDSLEQAFNMVLLSQLLMSAILLCVAGFQLLVALKVHDNVAALKHAIIIVTLLVQLYLYACAGDILESHTEEIAFAAYDSPWYDYNSDMSRDLTLIIMKGGTPHHVTAGKFLSMNLFTFKEILKASASYLSVLRVMME